MNAYLIRDRETKQLSAIAVAPTFNQLSWLLDSIGDPSDYEYLRFREGAVFFDDENYMPPHSWVWEGEDQQDECDPPDYSPPVTGFCEGLSELLHRPQKWKRFPFADQPGGIVHELIKDAERRRRRAASGGELAGLI